MKVVKGLYARNGYVVQTILMDLEFEKVRVDTDTLGIPDDFHRLHRFITLV